MIVVSAGFVKSLSENQPTKFGVFSGPLTGSLILKSSVSIVYVVGLSLSPVPLFNSYVIL